MYFLMQFYLAIGWFSYQRRLKMAIDIRAYLSPTFVLLALDRDEEKASTWSCNSFQARIALAGEPHA
ncbi:hypothetical protein BN2476_670054 [Paraburkholderia piptadeniae]|uniref:Uncharacterized protein n=1 Tax=Paraburkholderia piptadeniae TaxID=1701573 RepID=A0A1N7SNL2_9BURK|nr:hypothetical protein BN2476_670054 [Paraburkholderia piptadeniae]